MKKFIKRGRPKIGKPLIDQGTPELQSKRQAVLDLLNLKSEGPKYLCKTYHSAIFDGCHLHQLFYQNLLTEEQFKTGLYIRKIYTLCLRSQGVKNRLASSVNLSENKKGRIIDQFEQQEVEKKWRDVLLSIKQYAKTPQYMQLTLKVILNDFFKQETYSIVNLKDNFLKILRYSLDKLSLRNASVYSHPSCESFALI